MPVSKYTTNVLREEVVNAQKMPQQRKDVKEHGEKLSDLIEEGKGKKRKEKAVI